MEDILVIFYPRAVIIARVLPYVKIIRTQPLPLHFNFYFHEKRGSKAPYLFKFLAFALHNIRRQKGQHILSNCIVMNIQPQGFA